MVNKVSPDDTDEYVRIIDLEVNDDDFTLKILEHLGKRVAVSLDARNKITFDFPDSKSDLLIHDGEVWAPVVGAFVDETELYLIAFFGEQGYFVYSPTSNEEWTPWINCIKDKGEYYVNRLTEECIAKVDAL